MLTFFVADVDLRIAAGEAIIVMFENAFEHDEEGATLAIEDVIPKLQELSKDSHKYRLGSECWTFSSWTFSVCYSNVF